MAAVRDILPRAAAVGAVTTYQGQPAAWLVKAAAVAAQGHAVIVNVKGTLADDVPCIITLAALERLTRAEADFSLRNENFRSETKNGGDNGPA